MWSWSNMCNRPTTGAPLSAISIRIQALRNPKKKVEPLVNHLMSTWWESIEMSQHWKLQQILASEDEKVKLPAGKSEPGVIWGGFLRSNLIFNQELLLGKENKTWREFQTDLVFGFRWGEKVPNLRSKIHSCKGQEGQRDTLQCVWFKCDALRMKHDMSCDQSKLILGTFISLSL